MLFMASQPTSATSSVAPAAANDKPVLRTEGFGKTERKDAWWWEQAFTLVAFALFGAYGTWAVMQNAHYEIGPYLSPFFSPNLAEILPAGFLQWFKFSPAFLILWIPVGFRGTCYFYRRVYYRAIFNDPPACGVDKPIARPQNYTGESMLPFFLLNFHRYFLYLAIILAVMQIFHAFASLFYNGQFGFGVGTLIAFLDATLLTLYVFSCHSLRHLIGGKLNRFTGGWFTETRHKLWNFQSVFNQEHWFYAWASLFAVVASDLYVRLVSMGIVQDWNTWGQNWTQIAPHVAMG
jgi:hypothetical protein